MLAGDERLLAFDADAHLARLHFPVNTVIGIEHGLGFLARRHGNPLDGRIAVNVNGLLPVLLALVGGQDIGQPVDQLVRGLPGRQLGRFGGPGRDRAPGWGVGLRHARLDGGRRSRSRGILRAGAGNRENRYSRE